MIPANIWNPAVLLVAGTILGVALAWCLIPVMVPLADGDWLGFAGGIGGGLIGGLLTLAAGFLAFNAAMAEVKANADEALARKAVALRSIERMIAYYIGVSTVKYEKIKDLILPVGQSAYIELFIEYDKIDELIRSDDFWRVGDEIQLKVESVGSSIRKLHSVIDSAVRNREAYAHIAPSWQAVLEEFYRIKCLCERDLDGIRRHRSTAELK